MGNFIFNNEWFEKWDHPMLLDGIIFHWFCESSLLLLPVPFLGSVFFFAHDGLMAISDLQLW